MAWSRPWLSLLWLAGWLWGAPSRAADTISFQAVLTDSVGVPLAEGLWLPLEIRFYDQAEEGDPLVTVVQSAYVQPGGRLELQVDDACVAPGREPDLVRAVQRHPDLWLGVCLREGGPELAPRLRLGHAPAALAGRDTAPRGAIVLWPGSLASIPAGWVPCDGQNGTPDLRGSFPRGVSGQDPGQRGGSAAKVLDPSQVPAHDHPPNTTTWDGVHAHDFQSYEPDLVFNYYTIGGITVVDLPVGFDYGGTMSVFTNDAGSHTHPGTLLPAGDEQTIATEPPYQTMVFIIKQ